MEIIIGIIFIIVGVSIAQAICMLIFPKYGLKRAKKIYRKLPNAENAQRVTDFEWKVRRRDGFDCRKGKRRG